MKLCLAAYEDFGRLTYEMWRACRLVIDTGIHAFGWSREPAMDYLRSREAEEKLGSKFDQRNFHDAILALGSVPLPVLDERMTQFIADGGVNRR